MGKRYHITLGAKTSAGGTVVSASSTISIHGVKVALENDKVICPLCKSVGVIKPHGPRLRQNNNGTPVALEGDLCICKCPTPPRLIPIQRYSSQQLDGESHAAEVAKRVAAIATAPVVTDEKSEDALPLLLVHPETEEPFRYRSYRLELSENRVIEGTTDEQGATRPLTVRERESLIAWHID